MEVSGSTFVSCRSVNRYPESSYGRQDNPIVVRLTVEQCAKVNEVKEIRDKAAALAHYAKQCDDSELDLWMSQIRLRAIAQIGKISRELEKLERTRTDLQDSAVSQTKTKQLEDAQSSRRFAWPRAWASKASVARGNTCCASASETRHSAEQSFYSHVFLRSPREQRVQN